VADTEADLADVVGAIYEAAANGGSWESVGTRLCHLTNSQSAILRIVARRGEAPQNVLMPLDAAETAYLAYYHQLNPYFALARRDYAETRAERLGAVKLGPELVPDESLLRSEYYVDFARLHERRHLLTGMAGLDEPTPLSLFRAHGAEPFGAQESRIVKALLPHLQRALELRARLGQDSMAHWATRAALEALPISVAIVDAGLRIQFVNQAGRRDLGRADFGLRTLRSGPHIGAGVYLAARAKDDAAALRRLVMSATSGLSGGSMRVVNDDASSCAVLVSPAPHTLAADETTADGGAAAEKLAMVVMRELGGVVTPAPEMLCDVFGLSRAEADVAAALSGGASAEDVAQQRNVSLPTVRSQIRSILGKSESENLRDFERLMASLAVVTPNKPSDR